MLNVSRRQREYAVIAARTQCLVVQIPRAIIRRRYSARVYARALGISTSFIVQEEEQPVLECWAAYGAAVDISHQAHGTFGKARRKLLLLVEEVVRLQQI